MLNLGQSGLLLFLTALSAVAVAQAPQQLGPVTFVKTLPHGMELSSGRAAMRILTLTDSVIRVRFAPEGNFPQEHSWALLPQALESPVRVRVLDFENRVEFSTSRLTVRVEKATFRIAFLEKTGGAILEDAPGRAVTWGDFGFRVWKAMPEDEHYYGLGEKGGPLDRRNQAFTNWNTDNYGWQESTDPLYKSIPFFLALRKGRAYGLYLDNAWRSSFDFGKESRDAYSFGAEGGELDYYFIDGPHPKDVIGNFTALVGRMPLPPVWTLGYQQCRYSYFPEARVREVARTFREKKIPADVIYLDIDYQDGNRPFTVDRKLFPTFENMIRDLRQDGFHVIAITDLHIKKEGGYAPYDAGHAGDHFVKNPNGTEYLGVVWPGESVFPEFTLSRSREWWGGLYKDFAGMGIAGFWNDMNEPAIFERADKTMPLDVVHRMDDGSKLDHRAVHNVFGTLNGRATYDGLRKLRPNERPFVLTRAAYTGAWRWAASWTGDNTSSWNHLRLTIPTLLNLGISGYTLVGNDVGGFAGSPPADLLTRWMQLGVFTPIFRNHTQKGSADQEPWVHGPEHEAIQRRAIELRYRLLPYLYTYMEEATRTGLPVMRPLFLEYPNEEKLYADDIHFRNVFLFGRDLLVAPDVMERTDAYDVLLPKGDWFDYWTGARMAGGQTLKLAPALDVIPIYVRAGAIIPQQPVVQHTGEAPNGPLELRVYPGPDCSGSLYQDDGHTFAYTQGQYLRLAYTCQAGADSVRVKISRSEGSFTPWWDRLQIEIYGAERPPREVLVGRTRIKDWQHLAAARKVVINLAETGTAVELQVNY
ncbi:MAG: glycoside hydrolase family 31 protein [Acidobacteria bacterium]|nr:glycoside hydrolase family 31 protein [Acidobacteriota bacterium]